ncbi:hypothetical protein [Fulvivirga ligni]|uniref:hypothetical protein n=1 Tax=Fulvivirga ligni TaxID=2904246 RepID=UPI001F39DAE3|nr:hypothetical protein [Fulvivirga ligni]UII20686.1 hypothetical protein LVD16_22865 [Fulvivirga ligni]
MKYLLTLTFLSLICWACSHESPTDATITINSATVINDSYIGNGAQWDPYQLNYGDTTLQISSQDWDKLYSRLDFMKPQLMRVMTNTRNSVRDGKLQPELHFSNLKPILDYCQTHNIQVLFGDWGGDMVHSKENKIDSANLHFAAEYLDFLINQKGYSCIKYYNMINEPNGFWSATDGNYQLWANAIRFLHKGIVDLGLDNKVALVGPDAAIWSGEEAWWADSCATHLSKEVGLFDIHTYPSKVTVNSGEYTDIIKAYEEKVPEGKKIVMGEIGFKFVEPADSAFNKENISRAEAKKYASTDDSQMFVYDYSYGTDMADALFQTVNAGYSGSIVWMLDDAMHSKEAPNKLKVWGFWNIFGDEYFGSEEENVRPWYYAWSLLTKYMPQGSQIFEVKSTGDPSIKAIALNKNGQYMLAVVNVSQESHSVKIQSTDLKSLQGANKYIYSKNTLKKEGDHGLLPNETDLNINLSEGVSLDMPAESLIVISTFKNE